MIPGPTHVLECPHCKNPHLQLSLLSVGVGVVRVWTDGRTDGPVTQIAPRLTRCTGCRGFFWTDEARVIDNIPYGASGEKAALLDSPRILWPSVDDYREALAKKIFGRDKEKERYIRIHFWWAINDSLTNRLLPSFKKSSVDARIGETSRRNYLRFRNDNFRHLIKLLNPGVPRDRLILAEILRESGRFSESLTLFPYNFGDENMLASEKIRELAVQKNADVAELPLI